MIRIIVLLHTIFAFDTWTVSEVQGANHRCYVCIPNTGSSISDVFQTFQESSDIPLCNRFETGNADYIRECPSSSYQGCLTQTNGTHVTKTCTEVGLEDCKTANKIKYCYCKGDLCNREVVPVEATVPTERQDENYDDEEEEEDGGGEDEEDPMSEGSGFIGDKHVGKDREMELDRNQLPTTTTATTTTTTTTTETTKSVILTTNRPKDDGISGAYSTPAKQPRNLIYLISFLLVLRFRND